MSAQDNPHSSQGRPELGGVPPVPSPGCAIAQGRTPPHKQSFSPERPLVGPVLAGGGVWSRRRPESSLQPGSAAPHSGRTAQMRAFAHFFNVTVTLNSWLCLRHLGGIGLLSQEGEGKLFGLEPLRGVCVCMCVSHPRSPGTPTLKLLRTAGLDGRAGDRASAAQTFVRQKGSEACPQEAGDRGSHSLCLISIHPFLPSPSSVNAASPQVCH